MHILIMSLALVFLRNFSNAAGADYKPCVTKDDCGKVCDPTNPIATELVGCYDGLCKCFNTAGQGQKPKGTCTAPPESCKKACMDSDKKTKIIKNKEAYLCDKKCFCRFEQIMSSKFKKCMKDDDCKPNEKKQICKVELDEEKMETTTVECGNGVCKCKNWGKKLVGNGKPYCKADSYCEGLCKAEDSGIKAEFCSAKNGKYCYCPEE